jgi:hypothetical protein
MKNTKHKTNILLFVTALMQVSMVAMNVVFISGGNIPLMLITGFGISFLWTYNVKKIAFSTLKERVIYSLGALTGTYIGWVVAKFLENYLK